MDNTRNTKPAGPRKNRYRGAGRFLLTALRWLGNRITAPVVLIPLIVLLATWVGFQQNAGLYMRGTLPSALYDATLIAVLLLPPLTGQVAAWVTGHRSAFWWLLWVPAVALYWLRPWHTGTEWALFWREHLDLWQLFVQILREQEQAPLRSFVRLGGILTMALVSFMVLARSWMRFTTWLRDLGRDTFSHKGGIVPGEHTDPLKHDNPRNWKNQGKGRLITMNPGHGHVVLLAASTGYKTAGVVIPNILHYSNPLVVVDPKGDLSGTSGGLAMRLLVVCLCLAVLTYPDELIGVVHATARTLAGQMGAADGFSLAHFAAGRAALAFSLLEGLFSQPRPIQTALHLVVLALSVTMAIQIAFIIFWSLNLVFTGAAGLFAMGFGGLKETTGAARAYLHHLVGAGLALLCALLIIATTLDLAWDIRAAGSIPVAALAILLTEIIACILIWLLPRSIAKLAKG